MFDTYEDARYWWENSGYFDMERFHDFNEASMIDELWRKVQTDDEIILIVDKHLDIDGERHG